MKNIKFYILVTTLACLLFYSFDCHSQNTTENGDFEAGISIGNYTFIGNDHHSEVACCTVDFSDFYTINEIPINDFSSKVSLMDIDPFNTNAQNYDPVLYDIDNGIQLDVTFGNSSKSIKLNPDNETGAVNETEGNTTALMKTLHQITEPILSINFAIRSNKPVNTEDFLMVRFDILDSNGNMVSSQCLYSDHPDFVTASTTVSYLDWTCVNLDVSNLIGTNSPGTLRIIVNDFNKGYDTVMYVDDIGNNGNLCQNAIQIPDNVIVSEGDIFFDSFWIECPTDPFTVAGTYILPSCVPDPVQIHLALAEEGTATPIFTLTDITQFSGGTFSFDINPNDINPSMNYEIMAFITFSDGTTAVRKTTYRFGPDIVFENCITDDPCISITEIWLSNNNILNWNGSAPNYTLIIQQDESCCDPSEEVSNFDTIEIEIESNAFNLDEVLNSLGDCLKFKIKSDCDETSWCCAQYLPRQGWVLPNGSCLDNQECETLETQIIDNVFCWQDVSDHYEIEIIGANSCSNGEVGDMVPQNFSTTENCIDLFEIVDRLERKCFKIRINYSEDCPMTECTIGTGPNLTFVYEGECSNYVSLKEKEKTTITMFPNPVNNELIIKSNMMSIDRVNIVTLGGISLIHKLNLDTKMENINVNRLEPGMYIILIELQDGSKEIKNLIVE